jgi:Regulator of ribonuclease activity B
MTGRHPFSKLRGQLSAEVEAEAEVEAGWSRDQIDTMSSLIVHIAELMSEHGDALDQARPVQHWAYFATEAGRAQFIAFIAQSFADIEAYINPLSLNKEYAVSFWHTGVPDSESLTEIIETLALAAQPCGGEYDGWETQILS